MSLQELINSVEKTAKNKCWLNIEQFAYELGIARDLTYSVDEEKFPEIACYATTAYWLCTDTMVGILAYYLNDELVAISAQRGRKAAKEYEWVSEEKAAEVRDLILSRCSYELNLQTIDFNYDVTEWVSHGENWRKQ